MRRLRPVIGILVSLLLLVQGFAVAAGERTTDADSVAQVSIAPQTDTPCHGAMADQADGQSCCNAGCPDMSTCAFAHLAIGSLHTNPEYVPVPAAFAPVVNTRFSAFPPKSLLRPPIALYA